MTKQKIRDEAKTTRPRRSEGKEQAEQQATDSAARVLPLAGLQRHIGNRAVQRILAQRSDHGGFELDDETAERINRERSGGQPLEASAQARLSEAMGHDFSGVQVHTSPEADALNRGLGAKAFTSGQDVFFREGAYEPGTAAGQELIAHELTHVAQQSTGAVSGGARMTVNAPNDTYEQEANAAAKAVVGADTGSPLQRQVEEEEEEPVQAQVEEEEEEPVQTQVEEEEEEVMA